VAVRVSDFDIPPGPAECTDFLARRWAVVRTISQSPISGATKADRFETGDNVRGQTGGGIAPEFFGRKAADLRKQNADLICRANEIRAAEPAPVEDSLNLMDLTSRLRDCSGPSQHTSNSDSYGLC
jgi:hypothetical protein